MHIIDNIDPFDDRITNAMMKFRKLPAQLLSRIKREPLAPFDFKSFQQLDNHHDEIVFGLVGKFWQLNFGIVNIETSTDYLIYSEPEVAKLALNFHLQEMPYHSILLSTETRVFCSDPISYKKFSPYWYLIQLGSGFIRKKMLSKIKKLAESENHS